MGLLFIFTAIIACITTRLIVHFFKEGMTVLQLTFTVFLLAVCILLVGFLRGDFYIPFLELLVK